MQHIILPKRTPQRPASVPWLAAAALLVPWAAGCSDDDPEAPDARAPSRSVPDADPAPDASLGVDADAGLDEGLDAGPSEPRCPPGTEGCPCAASTDATATALSRDDCGEGLVCANFDAYGRNLGYAVEALPEGSMQACLRTCDGDADCGEGRFCSVTRFFGTSLTPRGFCVDRAVGVDEACGASRIDEVFSSGLDEDEDGEVDPMIDTVGAELVGCEPGLSCWVGILGPQFGPARPDQGSCLTQCSADADCVEVPGAPICQRDIFTSGDGFCGPRRDAPGTLCGTEDGRESEIFSFVHAECGTGGDNLICVTLSNQPRGGTMGLCVELCNDDVPCTFSDPGLGPQTCELTPDDPELGLCSSACGDVAWDTCEEGRTCLTLNLAGVPTPMCAEHREPALAPAVVDEFGNIIDPGGDCSQPLGLLRCPDDYVCRNGGPPNLPDVCVAPCDVEAEDPHAACEAVAGAGSRCVLAADNEGLCTTPGT
jgi:hypothetical protein